MKNIVDIFLKEKKRVFYCDIPLSKEQWTDILRDKEIVDSARLHALLAFYYMPDHSATSSQCAEKFGGDPNAYNSAIISLGKSVLERIAAFRIVDKDGHEQIWPVVMGVGKLVNATDDTFQWTLRMELIEALRDLIIKDALTNYTKAFTANWSSEEYKWRALKTFQDNWNIESPDFAGMLDKALSQTKNLLVSQSTFPRLMIVSYAKQAPETVREMFRNLYDESRDLRDRLSAFGIAADNLAQKLSPGKNHYQNTNVISTYLWLRFPGTHYIYKWGEYSNVTKKIGFDNNSKRNGSVAEVIKGFDNYDVLRGSIAQFPELLKIYNAILDDNPDIYYRPDGLATLTFDFGFWISRYYRPLIESVSVVSVLDVIHHSEKTSVHEPDNQPDNLRYWWLVASPKYWSFSELRTGDTVEYTVKNDKGNKRRIPANFENAEEGDIVIGYEANPVKKIVALARVAKASDGETIVFQKIEELEVPIPWASFKSRADLADMEFIKNQNGSFFRLTPEEYAVILYLIRQENPEPDDTNPIKQKADSESYGKMQFLQEVFMTEQQHDELVGLLRLKKNVILQGAPGVGKTFAAKRIAYSMMGQKDDSRIEMIQFHQNYSYEDFIMGYRPTAEGGFELRTGVFYNFCKKAGEQPEKDFFFIIDEINRGNLSKIFGELLMLIENNYRGHSIRLSYRNELFSVPENLYIIGMMNTADRSLAMIDYALRRRFSFHTMTPGFATDGFRAEMNRHDDPRIARIIDAIIALNTTIENDDSLGSGFCIGHSYFCAQPTDKQWINHVVRYDICPMLDEYWFDSKERCKSEKARLLDILNQ